LYCGNWVNVTADFALGRLGYRRRSHLAPSAFGTETFSRLNDLLPGLRKARGIFEPSLGERRVPSVAIVSVTFLTEVGLFILIGML
jgi:hypothetical protein